MSETYCSQLTNNSDKVFFTYTIRNLGIQVMKIMSLKTKVKCKCSFNFNFNLNVVTSKQKRHEQKKTLEGIGAGQRSRAGTRADRVEPTWQVGHDRQPSGDALPAGCLCCLDPFPVLQHATPPSWKAAPRSVWTALQETYTLLHLPELYLPTVSGSGSVQKFLLAILATVII